MRKIEVIKKITQQTKVPMPEVEKVLGGLFKVIEQAAMDNEPVYFRGFGSFLPTMQGEKLGRNLSTGEPVKVPKSLKLKFKQSQEIKQKLKSITI